MYKGGLFLKVWSFVCVCLSCFVLFLPLRIGLSPDGSCFDVFGYTDEHLNGPNHVLNV